MPINPASVNVIPTNNVIELVQPGIITVQVTAPGPQGAQGPAGSGGATPTGSLLTTASVSLNIITFTKGDGSTFPITVDTGSGGGGSTPTGSLLTTASVSLNTITFTKGNGDTFPITVNTGSGGGTPINTGSFATTGSNQFNGNQTITGSLVHGNPGNIATGEKSHAEGEGTQAIGNFSHAEGLGTIAYGNFSHAEGQDTIASGSHSHTEGNQTIALADHQHVQGRYNITSSAPAAFIVGNGTDSENRSNLIHAAGNEVQISGSFAVSGSVFLPSLVTSSTTVSNVVMFGANGQLFTTSSTAIGGGGGAGFPFAGDAVITGSLLVSGSGVTITGSLNMSGPIIYPIITQTANYTLQLSDAGDIVEINSASANTVTIPTSSTSNFTIGTQITLVQYGAGQTTVATGSVNVLLRSAGNATKIAAQYGGATLIKRGTDEWYLLGNITV